MHNLCIPTNMKRNVNLKGIQIYPSLQNRVLFFSYHLQEDITCKVIPATLYTENNSISCSISTTVSQVQLYYKPTENTCQILTDFQSYKGCKAAKIT